MKKLLTTLALLLFVGSVSAVLRQRQQLSSLRAQQQARNDSAVAAPTGNDSSSGSNAASGNAMTAELLQLRSEVTRLNARKRDLATVAAENDRLRAQLAESQANGSSGSSLPAGYIRKAQAQMKGFSSPENALQTFLWALQRHDAAMVLRACTPAVAQNLRPRLEPSANPEQGFFKETDSLPGMGIESQTPQPDGSVNLQVTVAPGLPSAHFRAELINGEWKLDSGGSGF